MMARRSLLVSLMALAPACALAPGAVKTVGDAVAPTAARTAVVRGRVCGRDGVALPEGWRLPKTAEASERWRDVDPDRFLVADADLDGDGRPDQARVLLRTDGSEFGLFAFLCRERDVVPHLILHNRELAYFKVIGIRTFGPGLYRTACGRGFIECYAGEPREVRVSHAAIDYFKNESVTALFYWSEDAQAFKWVAVTEGGVPDEVAQRD